MRRVDQLGIAAAHQLVEELLEEGGGRLLQRRGEAVDARAQVARRVALHVGHRVQVDGRRLEHAEVSFVGLGPRRRHAELLLPLDAHAGGGVLAHGGQLGVVGVLGAPVLVEGRGGGGANGLRHLDHRQRLVDRRDVEAGLDARLHADGLLRAGHQPVHGRLASVVQVARALLELRVVLLAALHLAEHGGRVDVGVVLHRLAHRCVEGHPLGAIEELDGAEEGDGRDVPGARRAAQGGQALKRAADAVVHGRQHVVERALGRVVVLVGGLGALDQALDVGADDVDQHVQQLLGHRPQLLVELAVEFGQLRGLGAVQHQEVLVGGPAVQQEGLQHDGALRVDVRHGVVVLVEEAAHVDVVAVRRVHLKDELRHRVARQVHLGRRADVRRLQELVEVLADGGLVEVPVGGVGVVEEAVGPVGARLQDGVAIRGALEGGDLVQLAHQAVDDVPDARHDDLGQAHDDEVAAQAEDGAALGVLVVQQIEDVVVVGHLAQRNVDADGDDRGGAELGLDPLEVQAVDEDLGGVVGAHACGEHHLEDGLALGQDDQVVVDLAADLLLEVVERVEKALELVRVQRARGCARLAADVHVGGLDERLVAVLLDATERLHLGHALGGLDGVVALQRESGAQQQQRRERAVAATR